MTAKKSTKKDSNDGIFRTLFSLLLIGIGCEVLEGIDDAIPTKK